ncbi:MAG TPA: hypothetical protein VN808_12375 [Stellaceae bacterium]|nr:hypothetical protein [Stellaceae bacterium]
MFFDKHLSPDQITGVWESNEPARQTIECLFGPEALTRAQEYLQSAGGVRNPPAGDPPDRTFPSPNIVSGTQSPTQDHPSEPDRALVLEINPTWGVQKLFQHYRAALAALSDNPARDQPAVARFRQANIDVEERLRAKLPGCMGQIGAIYQSAGLEP